MNEHAGQPRIGRNHLPCHTSSKQSQNLWLAVRAVGQKHTRDRQIAIRSS